MKRKTIFIAALLAIISAAIICLAGCSNADTAAISQSIENLPFTVPDLFTYNADATEKNGMLTFTSDNRTTLIVSCSDASNGFLEQSRSEPMTEASLVASYKSAGLDVTITDLDKQDTDSALIYTYTVHLSTQNGTTITRKYIKITDGQILDISCGGNVTNEDTIDVDYGAVLTALQ